MTSAPALSSAGFRSARMDEPVKFVADEERAGHLLLPDGALARAFVVYDFPRSITPAWFHQIARVATVAEADIVQLHPAAARRALITHANTHEAMGGRRLAEEAQDAAPSTTCSSAKRRACTSAPYAPS